MKDLGIDVLLNEHRVLRGAGTILLAGVTAYGAVFHMPENGSLPSVTIERDRQWMRKSFWHTNRRASIRPLTRVSISNYRPTWETDIPLAYPHGLVAAFFNGMHRYRSTQVFVNPGAGCWGPKFRLGAEAEITAIVISSPVNHYEDGDLA